MLHRALELEVDDYLDRHRENRDEHGHALVTRNGKARTRKLNRPGNPGAVQFLLGRLFAHYGDHATSVGRSVPRVSILYSQNSSISFAISRTWEFGWLESGLM